MFKGIGTLPNLSISYNQELRIIDSEAFSSLTNLVDLKLRDNRIEKIERNFLSTYSSTDSGSE